VLENTFDRKRISANSSPNPNDNKVFGLTKRISANSSPNPNDNKVFGLTK